jgi:hypothetical protein
MNKPENERKTEKTMKEYDKKFRKKEINDRRFIKKGNLKNPKIQDVEKDKKMKAN